MDSTKKQSNADNYMNISIINKQENHNNLLNQSNIIINTEYNNNANNNINNCNAAASNIIQLPDINSLCCYICTDFYTQDKKPLILVCGHTFCESCLTNLFDSCKEIQCSFCKIITKLEKFDDMIINYSMLNICEIIQEKNKDNINLNIDHNNENNNINTSILIPAFKSYDKFNIASGNGPRLFHQNNIFNKNKICNCKEFNNIKELDKLLECLDCEVITCKECFYVHKNHKLTNIVDFIEMKSETLLKKCQEYKGLSAKMAALHKKMDKSELEKIVKIEKEKINMQFKEMKNLMDKNLEIILYSMDKLLNDYINSIDEFKKNVKIFNGDSQRYYNIINEFSNFHKLDNKERQKVLKLFNFNQFCSEIKSFNSSVSDKMNSLITNESFYKDFVNKLKNINTYKNKILKVIKLANEKASKRMTKDNKVYYFKSFKRS
jgi:hypothetical protein